MNEQNLTASRLPWSTHGAEHGLSLSSTSSSSVFTRPRTAGGPTRRRLLARTSLEPCKLNGHLDLAQGAR